MHAVCIRGLFFFPSAHHRRRYHRRSVNSLGKTEKMVVADDNGHSGTSAPRVTQDVAQIMTELPTVVEGVTSVQLCQLPKAVPVPGLTFDGFEMPMDKPITEECIEATKEESTGRTWVVA